MPPSSGSKITIGKPVARHVVYWTIPAASLPRTISALDSRVINTPPSVFRSFSRAMIAATQPGTSQIVRKTWQNAVKLKT